MLDLDKVDPQKLFQLPDKEVRKHFFRTDQHYEIVQRKPHIDTTTPGNLEAKIAAVVIGLVSAALLGMINYHQTTGAFIMPISGEQQVITYVIILVLIGLLFFHRN